MKQPNDNHYYNPATYDERRPVPLYGEIDPRIDRTIGDDETPRLRRSAPLVTRYGDRITSKFGEYKNDK